MDPCIPGTTVGDTWTSVAGAAYQAGAGRFGGGSLRITNGSVRVTTANLAETWWGFGLAFSLGLGGDQIIFAAEDVVAGVTQIQLAIRANGTMQFKVGNTYVGAPTAPILVPGVKYTFQIHELIDAAVGLLEMRFNGDADTLLSFTGNTKNGANAYANRFSLQAGGGAWDFFDIWGLDANGTPTGWQGDLLIRDAPIIGDSATPGKNVMASTPAQPAGSHYLDINDSNDATYLASSNVGDIERFRIQPPFPTSPPRWIGSRVRTLTDDAGPRKLAPMVAQGASESVGADFSVPSSAGWTPWQAQDKDPATSAPWTSAGAATAEVGAKITA